MHKILITWKYFGFGDKKENIERLFLKYNCVGELLSLEEAIPKLAEFEVIIIGTDRITTEILDKAPNLKLIMMRGISLKILNNMSSLRDLDHAGIFYPINILSLTGHSA